MNGGELALCYAVEADSPLYSRLLPYLVVKLRALEGLMTRPVPGSIVAWRGTVGGTCNDAHHAARCGNLARKRDIMQQETKL